MGSFVFKWPHTADEVYVTGTFDNWGKTVKLEKKGGIFEKEVELPTADEKVYYKFVVDGSWTTDHAAPQEDDGHQNINNVLVPEDIEKTQKEPIATGGVAAVTGGSVAAAIMSGVTPDSTTAAMAAQVPKESEKAGDAAISSAAPESTTAELAKDVPVEKKTTDVPGGFPDTPAQESDQVLSVNPIPATAGAGNPIQLAPGEKVPDHSTLTANTVESTVSTDKAGYEKDASAPIAGGLEVPPVSNNMIPESSLPIESGSGPHIQSAAPESTTAALAAEVPLETKAVENGTPAAGVPEVVKESLDQAHEEPEAAASGEAVQEKKEVESELLKSVPVEESTGTPAPVNATETAPTSGDVSPLTKPGEETSTAPAPSEPTVTTGVAESKAPETSNGKTESSAPATTKATEGASTNDTATKEKKKKNRASGFFAKLKEKFK